MSDTHERTAQANGIALIDDAVVPLGSAQVSANDRALYFGDGVYEVVRAYAGRLWLFDEHMARFRRSLAEVEIDPGGLGAVRDKIVSTYEAGGIAHAAVYWHVSRGVAPRSHGWDDGIRPTLLVTVRPFEPDAEALAHGAAAITQPDLRWKRCDIKTLNLLPNVMAKQRAHRAGCFEAVLVDDRGVVTEGTSTSVFIVRGGQVWTHPQQACILPGITRDYVIGLAHEAGIGVRREAFTRDELLAADEVFLTGTGTEVTGLVRVDDTPIGPGRRGPITARLHDLYRAHIEAFAAG